MDSAQSNPPRNLLARLQRLEGYSWGDSTRAFHSSYDRWHIFGTRYEVQVASPNRQTSFPSKAPDALHRGGFKREDSNSSSSSQSVDKKRIPVVARISTHALREERAYHICKTLSAAADPEGNHITRPIESFRLPSIEEDEGPIVVSIFEDPGENYLPRVIDYGPAWRHLELRGDAIQGLRNETFAPQSMSLQVFLDFAIGAAECLEVLHCQQIVHGELRGDAFHMKEGAAKVTLSNIGPGRLRSFEPGLTSTGWSIMAKEVGAVKKLSYMSPEQTGRTALEPDSRTDIFSLGVLMWEILAQGPAFKGDTPMEVIQAVLGHRLPPISHIRMDIPDAVCRIIQKATAKAVWDRYHSARGLRHDLTEVRRLLGSGATVELQDWELATKDVSPTFILPQALVGRGTELDAILQAIDHCYRLHSVGHRRGKLNFTHLSRLSDNQKTISEETLPIGGLSLEPEISSTLEGSLSQPTLGYKANISRSRSSTTSRHEPITPGLSSSNTINKPYDNLTSASLESPDAETVDDEIKSSVWGSEIGESILVDSGSTAIHHGRCEVITIAGSSGLGKSRLVQSVHGEVRKRGLFASTKFHHQTDIRPFDSIIILLSTLFQQVFSESNIDPVLYQALKRRVMPSWSTLHKTFGLPQFLFRSKTPTRKASLSGKLSKAYNRSLESETKRRSSSSTSTSSGGVQRSNHGSQSSQNFLRAGSSTTTIPLMNTLLDILRIFARHKFVCLCLDDIHWADEQSLELLTQIVATKIKLVLILAYRPEEIALDSIKHILDPPQSEDNRVNGDLEIFRITLMPLNEDQTTEYVINTVRRTGLEVAHLGKILQSKTAGNPFFIKEVLNACHRKKLIWFDFRNSEWAFDLASIDLQFDTENFNSGLHEGLVMSRLSELRTSSKSVLAWASMFGLSFSFALIQRLMTGGFTPKPLRYSEKEAVNGLRAALEAFIVVPTQDDDVFRFADDRYLQAAMNMQEDDREMMNFVLAQNMLKHYASDEDYRDVAASSVCESMNLIKKSVAHRQPYRTLLFEYARLVCETGVRSPAVKVYAACIALFQDDMWNDETVDVSYEETLQVHTAAAECYLYEGMYDDAKLLFSSIFSHAKTAFDKTPSWILSSRAFAQAGDSTRAFQALKECLIALEVRIEDNPTFPKCDAEFKRLCQRIKSIDTSSMLSKAAVEEDAALAAIGAVLVEATSAAFWSDTLTFYQMTLIMVDTFLSTTGFPQAGMGFLQLSLIAITRHNMIDFANDCGDIALSLIEHWRDPYTMGRGGTIYPTFLGHLQRPIHTLFGRLDEALDFSIQAGDRISTILNYGLAANLRFFASQNLTELESFCTYACQDISNWQSDTLGGTMIITVRQVCRALQGHTYSKDPMLGVMSDEHHDSPKYKSWLLRNVKNSDRPLILYESIEIAPLFLYGHYSSAVSLGNSCLKKISAIWSARNTRFLMFFHALSLAGCIWVRIQEQFDPVYRKASPHLSSDVDGRSFEPGLQEEVDGVAMLLKYFLRKIEQWQVVTNINYLAWSKILAAQIAEMENDHPASLRLYEEAIDHASAHRFLLEEALANQLLADHLIRVGSKRLARMALRESISLYRKLGAMGVANHVETQHHQVLWHMNSSPYTADVGVQTTFTGSPGHMQHIDSFEPGSTHHSGLAEHSGHVDDRIGIWQKDSALLEDARGPAIHMLDLTSILESSQVISSVLQVDQLLKTMCEIILQNCKGVATLTAVVIEDSALGWSLVASGYPEEGAQAHIPPLPLKAAFIAENVVYYSSRFREMVFVHDLMQDQRFSNVSETWVARNPDSKSVVAIPIAHGEVDKPLLGILYLEGETNAFTTRNLEILQLLVNQIGISYANSLTLKEVERVSAINKSMVEIQKRALSEAIEAKNNANIAQVEAVQSAKLAEEAAKIAEEAANAKTTFLANISHELRTPLNGVIGNSELLLLDKQLKEGQVEMANSIRVSANLLLSLINDILDFSKIEAHQMQLHLTAFDIEAMIRELIRSIPFAWKHKSKDVRVVQDLQLPKSLVFGDPVRLHQILGNLVGNSLKFTEKGTISVVVKTESETDSEVQILFAIQDTGIGISSAQLPKLFKPFSQADASTSRKYGGSGLGLSICKSLVESMGGTIKLQSKEGVGTNISFSLTLQKATPEAAANIARPEAITSRALSYSKDDDRTKHINLSKIPLSEMRVCIAEDNLINQKIAVQFLQKLRFSSIDAYDNGQEAVEGIRAKAKEGRPYHMILMDVQMPVLDGYEATKLLRRDEAEEVRSILVIALTASAVQGDREKCLAAGMNDYLAKPVRLALLKERLKDYMRLE